MGETNAILIVDSEPGARRKISRELAFTGMECHHAADAAEALTIAASVSPLLLVASVIVPGQDGARWMRELKERSPHTEVLVIAESTQADSTKEFLREGGVTCLVKPVNPEALRAAAQRAIEKAQQKRQVDNDTSTESEEIDGPLDPNLEIVQPDESAETGSLLSRSEPSQEPVLEEQTSVRSSRRTSPQEPMELSVLRAAGDALGRGASTTDIVEAMARELVDSKDVPFLRLWLHESSGLQLALEHGVKGAPGFPHADRAASALTTHVVPLQDGKLVNVPILLDKAVLGVLQVGWKHGAHPDDVELTEQLALFLTAPLAWERESEDLKKTVRELDLFCEIASVSRYTIDLQGAAQFIMDSLHKVVDYDVAGLLLLDKPASLSICPYCRPEETLIGRVRSHILNTLRFTCGVELGEELETFVGPAKTEGRPGAETPEKLRSFVNVPFTVGESVAGLIHVSSGQEDAFADEDILFLNRAAVFLARAVEGARKVMTSVTGQIEVMVEHMTDGVLMLGPRGQVLAMNGAARRILKVHPTPDRPIGVAELTKVLDFDPLRLIRAERRNLRRVVVLHGVPYQAQISPVLDADGRLTGTVLAFRDFSEEKKVDEMKSEFINIVSHEIRTPLTSIKNATDLLAGSRLGELNEDQRRFVTMARNNTEQLTKMVTDLLDLSKIEAGKMTISLKPLSVGEPIERAVTNLRPQAEEKGIALELAIAPDLPDIYGEVASIRRVMANLVGNAIKFTDPGGAVKVEVKKTLEAGAPKPEAVTVSVTDTGVGIPKEHLQSIFDKFHQVEGQRSKEVVGTGLGLPIVQELVKAHHGTISVESEPGRGSSFTFTIPVLSPDDLFFRCLNQDMERAQRLASPLSLVVIRIHDTEELISRLGENGLQELLDRLEHWVRKETLETTARNLLCRERGEILTALPRTAREAATSFGQRLCDGVRSDSDVNADIDLTWSAAGFPEDGATAEKLLRVARERLTAVGP